MPRSGVLDRELAGTLQALNREVPLSRKRPRKRPLVIHASHDLALAELRDLLSKSGDTTVDLHFRGSLDCLASLARGECDVAGLSRARVIRRQRGVRARTGPCSKRAACAWSASSTAARD